MEDEALDYTPGQGGASQSQIKRYRKNKLLKEQSVECNRIVKVLNILDPIKNMEKKLGKINSEAQLPNLQDVSSESETEYLFKKTEVAEKDSPNNKKLYQNNNTPLE